MADLFTTLNPTEPLGGSECCQLQNLGPVSVTEGTAKLLSLNNLTQFHWDDGIPTDFNAGPVIEFYIIVVILF